MPSSSLQGWQRDANKHVWQLGNSWRGCVRVSVFSCSCEIKHIIKLLYSVTLKIEPVCASILVKGSLKLTPVSVCVCVHMWRDKKKLLLCDSDCIQMNLPINKQHECDAPCPQIQERKIQFEPSTRPQLCRAHHRADTYRQGPLCRLCAAGRAPCCHRSLRCWSGAPPAARPGVSTVVWGSTRTRRSMTPYSPSQAPGDGWGVCVQQSPSSANYL